MAMTDLAAAVLEAAVKAVQEHGSQVAAARALGIPRTTLQSRLREAEARSGVPDEPEQKLDLGAYKLGGDAKDREIIRLRDENARLAQELKAAHRETLDEDAVRDALRVLADTPADPPKWLHRVQAKSGNRTPHVAIAVWSDWHGGETVSRDELNGVNHYDPAVMDARVRRLVERTINLAHEYGPGRCAGAVINLLGDFVSGGLHPELAKTDAEEVLPSVLRVRDLLVWALRRMVDAFGQVYVPCTAGNHGRGTPKPEFKRYVYKNFDWLIYQLLQREFADDPRVRFDVRSSNDVHYRVFGHRFLAMHGDMLGVKGGDGIIGAIGPIMRGEIKVRGWAGSVGLSYDTLLIGHWHQQLWLPRAIVANTLKGYCEYAKNQLRAPISAPSQPLWFMHPKVGVTSKWDIFVDEHVAPKEALPWVSVFEAGVA